MKNTLINLISLAAFVAVLTACKQESGSSDGKGLLPIARGEMAEVILVMDSAQWNGPVGKEIRSTFAQPVPGLNRTEPLFELKHVVPASLNSVLKSAKNMIFVTVLSSDTRAGKMMKSYYTKESLRKIESNDSLFYFTKKDHYARGQEVLYLFGKDETSLIEILAKNRLALQSYLLGVKPDDCRRPCLRPKKRPDRSAAGKAPFQNKDTVWLRAGEESERLCLAAAARPASRQTIHLL